MKIDTGVGSVATPNGLAPPLAIDASWPEIPRRELLKYEKELTGTYVSEHPLAGADLRYDLRITLQESVHGVEKDIEFPVLGRCETCSGSGAKPGSEPITCDQCGDPAGLEAAARPRRR